MLRMSIYIRFVAVTIFAFPLLILFFRHEPIGLAILVPAHGFHMTVPFTIVTSGTRSPIPNSSR